MTTPKTSNKVKSKSSLEALEAKSARSSKKKTKKSVAKVINLKDKIKNNTKAKTEKIPETIEGKGFKFVNVRSVSDTRLVIESSVIATSLYNWDSDIVNYEMLHMAKKREPISIPIGMMLSVPEEDLDELKHSCVELYEKLQSVAKLRKSICEENISQNKPIDFWLLPEILSNYKDKNILFLNVGAIDENLGKGKVYGRLVSAEIMNTFGGLYLFVNYKQTFWDGSNISENYVSFTIDSDKPKTLKEWGFDLSPTQETLNELYERGKKVILLNKDCAYVYTRGWVWSGRGFFARGSFTEGRAIVDKAGKSMFDFREDGEGTINSVYLKNIEDCTFEQICAMNPLLPIFSFASKKWGYIHVDYVSDINFREDAFEKLVLPEGDKKLVYSLVRNSDSSVVSDVIDNKGGGCVLLLHGNPGLGKTLTAEAVAETLKRPLYAVGVAELGTEPESLEKNLQRVLQIAQRWNAVLLLDEADIFLEQRQSGDIYRNAMVGIFLRLLEYYNGVLILTTNRVEDIDKAFYSRISLALKYNDFDTDARYRVVKNLLDTNGVHLEESEIREIASANVNGRQIKNAIRIARFVGKDENRNVESRDVMLILNKLKDFQNSFKSN